MQHCTALHCTAAQNIGEFLFLSNFHPRLCKNIHNCVSHIRCLDKTQTTVWDGELSSVELRTRSIVEAVANVS